MDEDTIFGFSSPVADQLLKTIGITPKPPDGSAGNNYTALSVAYTTAGATARSGTTLGTGTATLYYLDQSGTTRTLTTQTIDVTFYNMSSVAVAATKYLMLLRLGDTWLANWEDC